MICVEERKWAQHGGLVWGPGHCVVSDWTAVSLVYSWMTEHGPFLFVSTVLVLLWPSKKKMKLKMAQKVQRCFVHSSGGVTFNASRVK